MDPRLVIPYVIAALIVWRIYMRMRRSFGRQRVQDRRMWARVGIFSAATVLVSLGAVRDLPVLAGLLAGIACGAVLGYVGLRHTKFEVTPEGRFFTPHTYIGLAVSALFIGRLLYRLPEIYGAMNPAGGAGRGLATPYRQSPFTLAVFGAVVGYYVLYYLGVLQRTRPSPSLPEAGAASTPGR